MNIPIKGLLFEFFPEIHEQSSQQNGRRYACSDFQLNAAECLEAYGIKRGNVLCRKYMDDFDECKRHGYSIIRSQIMTEERVKKIATGQIKYGNYLGKSYPWDSYVDGLFYP